MSKVVRLNNQVMNDIEKILDNMKKEEFQDDPVMWHQVFDDADENFVLQYVLGYFIHNEHIQ